MPANLFYGTGIPACIIVLDKEGLGLNIDMHNNDLDFELAKNIGEYFRLSSAQKDGIINQVLVVVSNWETIAKEIGISRSEIEMMSKAFIVH